MLASGTAERHHQVLKPAPLIIIHARVYQRNNVGHELMHTLLLIKKIDHRHIFSSERFESLLAPRIRDAARIENKPSAMPALVFRQSPMKRKTENPHRDMFPFRSQPM